MAVKRLVEWLNQKGESDMMKKWDIKAYAIPKFMVDGMINEQIYKQIAELTFGLHPTSVLVKRGHSIRLAIAGHDRDTFAKIPSDTAPTITVSRSKSFTSFVDLPTVWR
jgi:hypothetical protein